MVLRHVGPAAMRGSWMLPLTTPQVESGFGQHPHGLSCAKCSIITPHEWRTVNSLQDMQPLSRRTRCTGVLRSPVTVVALWTLCPLERRRLGACTHTQSTTDRFTRQPLVLLIVCACRRTSDRTFVDVVRLSGHVHREQVLYLEDLNSGIDFSFPSFFFQKEFSLLSVTAVTGPQPRSRSSHDM